ncbi:hypothetical protein [Actinoplanes regularis]|uniref:Uncharacterized protein n=1 Tax=Actinoplanes regularis TaxID=52697 RepID=A0A238UV32_9ACTN|nr:hypothetical protein [Actinoplanes regularis]GIE84381.1 hypothetical protein Are01nite_08610 [Actinoplanes regularis]SNR25878.1 hypothetical protein SAMN06264365_101199 [Actinoplanes regularis]
MTAARSLHEIIAGLTGNAATSGDLAAALHAGGHPDLPAELLAEAVVSFADTAPAEIAEHLAPFVMTHGPIPEGDAAAVEIDKLPDLLATAPTATFNEVTALAAAEIDPAVDSYDIDAGHASGDDAFDLDAGHLTGDGSHGGAEGIVGTESASLDMAFGHGHDFTAAPDDIAFHDGVPEATPGEYADLPEPADVALPTAELWAPPTLPDEAPEIDDLDDLDLG